MPLRRTTHSFPWYADQSDGTYQNPILFADYSDPDVIRVADTYYLVASSFTCTPGLPILRSRDLVNWTLIGHALENLPDPRYAEVIGGAGIWAPSIREHAGTFYLFAPTPDEGIYVLTAPSPEGPWSAPKLVLEGRGLIDPCPFWDDDGKAYLVHAYARSRAGIKDRLRVRPMAPDASSVLGEGEIVYSDPEHQPTLEGPKFTKRNGFYYILAPAGGVKTGWQLALRGRSPYGPYEAKTVLEQGTTSINGPHQGALVDTPEGEWWFVHFHDAGVYGRLVHLNPVTWVDDWPLMGIASDSGVREPVERYPKPKAPWQSIVPPQASDEFDGPTLGLQWQWQANHRSEWWSMTARAKHLRLFPWPVPDGDLARAPNLLLQKLPAESFAAETMIELTGTRGSSRAGLAVMGETHAAVAIEEAPRGYIISLIVDNRVVERVETRRGLTRVGVHFEAGGTCRFFHQTPGEDDRPFATVFQATPGRWIGAKIGVFHVALRKSASGHADFRYFRFDVP